MTTGSPRFFASSTALRICSEARLDPPGAEPAYEVGYGRPPADDGDVLYGFEVCDDASAA